MTSVSSRVLILGIGNPGPRYARTYHNAGILFVDALKDRLAPDGAWTSRPAFSYLKHGGVVLAKSRVFMNESGRTAADALRFLRYAPEELVVAHDDADIAIGAAKVSRGRGAAGHNGVASVIAALNTRDFRRARIGTRQPRDFNEAGLPAGTRPKRVKAGDFALLPISSEARAAYDAVFQRLMSALIVNETPSGTGRI
ncbi:MAG: aminoacyl-tRNA hydrolase [Candidatus Liptonbacteria bacterium]|nr:aminoacyl-tRNA hydrolase [Candidatus Liptonbacteria bacterium]